MSFVALIIVKFKEENYIFTYRLNCFVINLKQIVQQILVNHKFN